MLPRDDVEIFIGSINNVMSDIILFSSIRASHTIYIEMTSRCMDIPTVKTRLCVEYVRCISILRWHTVYVYRYTRSISLAKYGNESGMVNLIHKSTWEYKRTVTSPKLEGEIEKDWETRDQKCESLTK